MHGPRKVCILGSASKDDVYRQKITWNSVRIGNRDIIDNLSHELYLILSRNATEKDSAWNQL